MLTVVIPLAGSSRHFPKEDYPFPTPLIEVAGKTMIERVIDNLHLLCSDVHYIFIVPQDDVAKYSLDRTLQILTDNNCTVVALKNATRGALCSTLMAINHIDLESPLLIVNGDQIIDYDLGEVLQGFKDESAVAGVISFQSVHPRWSYVAVDEKGSAGRFAEKSVISKNAIAGFYYFESGSVFFNVAKASMMQGDNLDGIYYIAPCLNQLILDGKKVAVKTIPSASYHSFFSPTKVKEFEDWLIRESITLISDQQTAHKNLTIVIPAAGEGSRFHKAGYKNRKPFIPVMGKPMVTYVLDNLRTLDSQPVMLFRTEHIKDEAAVRKGLEQDGCKIVEVDALTEGTACTVLLARTHFDNDSPLLIANSDQYVDFECDAFVKDCLDRDLDGSILVFKDPSMDPKWSFARVDSSGLVQEVAEKTPISDLATVGIYLFRKGNEFVKAAVDMFASNDRVNGEFYTCPVYNYMIKQGLKIGVYEVPMAAMHGLGTPNDLDLFLDKMDSQ